MNLRSYRSNESFNARLLAAAKRLGTTASEIIRKAVTEYLDRMEDKTKNRE